MNTDIDVVYEDDEKAAFGFNPGDPPMLAWGQYNEHRPLHGWTLRFYDDRGVFCTEFFGGDLADVNQVVEEARHYLETYRPVNLRMRIRRFFDAGGEAR